MTRSSLRAALGLSLAWVGGCADHTPPSRVTFAHLGGDVARVGADSIPAALVADVARRAAPDPGAVSLALEALVEDATAAEGARLHGLDRTVAVQWASAAALARRVIERAAEQARAKGPPSDEEVESVVVMHAVVQRTRYVDDVRGTAVAEAISRAVTGTRDEDEFRTRAEAAPHAGLLLTVERVGPFDVSGEGTSGESFDSKFVAAAFALRSPGDTSPVIATPFGWHVIRLLERKPPDGGTAESVRAKLADAVMAMRVRLRITGILRAARERTAVEVYSAADSALEQAIGAK